MRTETYHLALKVFKRVLLDKAVFSDEDREGSKKVFEEKLLTMMKSHLFTFEEKDLVFLLQKTNNQIFHREIPYDIIFIDTFLKIGTLKICGLLLTKCFWDGEKMRLTLNPDKKNNNEINPNWKEDINIFYFGDDESDNTFFYQNHYLLDSKILDVDNPDNKFNLSPVESSKEKINLFVCNFLDFLNNPDVKITIVKRSEEQNLKRIKRNKPPLPTTSFIRLMGELKVYLNKLNSNLDFSYSHKFWVRGHFRTLRDDKWKNKQGTKIWIPPFIKGQGILVKKPYKITEQKTQGET